MFLRSPNNSGLSSFATGILSGVQFGQNQPETAPVAPLQPAGFYDYPNPMATNQSRFVVVGDSGAGQPFVDKFGAVLRNLFEKSPFYTLLMLGDNVYGTGEDGRHPEDGSPQLFESRIKQPFQGLLEKGVQLFGVLGNHDVRGKQETEQLKYLGVPRYYGFTRGNTDFFALDTTVMLPGYDQCYADQRDFAHQETAKMLDWLDKALDKSKSKYRVVMGHYPMYCSGRYNNRGMNAELVRILLQPILVKHQVDLYLCGHEHHYERSAPIYGTQHFLTGSSSKLTKKVRHVEDPPYPREKLVREPQVMLFDETEQGLAYQSLSTTGSVLDSGVVLPKDRQPQRVVSATKSNPTATDMLSFLKQATAFLHRPEPANPPPESPENSEPPD